MEPAGVQSIEAHLWRYRTPSWSAWGRPTPHTRELCSSGHVSHFRKGGVSIQMPDVFSCFYGHKNRCDFVFLENWVHITFSVSSFFPSICSSNQVMSEIGRFETHSFRVEAEFRDRTCFYVERNKSSLLKEQITFYSCVRTKLCYTYCVFYHSTAYVQSATCEISNKKKKERK